MACGKVIANEVISVKSLDISPDGRYLAVIHSSTYSLHLKVVDLETGGMIVDDDDFHHTLPVASQPIRAVRWLDNGGRLLYSDGRDIRELELGSSRVTVMAACQECWGFDLLPDRRTAAVAIGVGRSATIQLRDLLSLDAGRILADTERISGPRWSTGGAKIAYIDGDRVNVMDMSTRRRIELGEQWHNSLAPMWLTDDDVLLPDAQESVVWRVNVENGERELYVDVKPVHPQLGRILGVAGSRDGRFLVVQPENGNLLAVVDTGCLLRP
jgi:Tol biopolymer transport system component